ncbi:MAG TPA: cytochrome c peroxidase [Xanthobacteraceae bacterium]|nr:cytochrome c peroxidase [Xanthobacteraceae bacterium]
MRRSSLLLAAGMIVIAIPSGLSTARPETGDEVLSQAQQTFGPLPDNMANPKYPLTPERVDLGRKLFFDPRISADGAVSCSRCHLPALYGTDGLAKPLGAHDRVNPRNAPTILNAALQFAEHWRGDRVDVEDQAKQSLIGPPSFGNADYAAAMAKLKAIPGYAPLFDKAFPGQSDPITPDNWGQAIGAYERTLVTPSRFDDYLRGNASALSDREKNGLHLFMEKGCIGCHNGPGVGGGMFRKFGVMEDYWKETGASEPDKGRFDVTKDPADLYVFKVPSLRNVAMTGPYFHDGSVKRLPEAVRIMGQVQLGQSLTSAEIGDITAFLASLTGKLPADFVAAPVLPPSGLPDVNTQDLQH